MEKTALYKQLSEEIEKSNLDEPTKKRFQDIMVKLNKGKMVQSSSANLMEFLVQDLLDFAQIKAGKFRKNIKKFNIKEAIESVLNIQSYKA